VERSAAQRDLTGGPELAGTTGIDRSTGRRVRATGIHTEGVPDRADPPHRSGHSSAAAEQWPAPRESGAPGFCAAGAAERGRER